MHCNIFLDKPQTAGVNCGLFSATDRHMVKPFAGGVAVPSISSEEILRWMTW